MPIDNKLIPSYDFVSLGFRSFLDYFICDSVATVRTVYDANSIYTNRNAIAVHDCRGLRAITRHLQVSIMNGVMFMTFFQHVAYLVKLYN